jgi:hypothetical protein
MAHTISITFDASPDGEDAAHAVGMVAEALRRGESSGLLFRHGGKKLGTWSTDGWHPRTMSDDFMELCGEFFAHQPGR